MFATASTKTDTTTVLYNLDDIDLYGISYDAFQDSRLVPSSYRLNDRTNIVTTFRFKDGLNHWYIARFYGSADTAEVATVAAWAATQGLTVEYRVTCWGKPLEQLGGSDWKVAL